MARSWFGAVGNYFGRLTRRDLLKSGGLLAAPALVARSGAAPPPARAGLAVGPEIYQSIGVRPLINCRGTLTIIGGSLELPEVRAAKEAAALHYVQLDELMDAIGARLAELTGAEWGVVTSGCAAGLAHSTAACVAGGNPDRHVRIPHLAGFPKDEVIIPKHSRNVYDAAVRSIGVRVIEVGTNEELEAALGPKTAMIYIFAGPRADAGPPSYDDIIRMARQRNVPVLVDAAAEVLTIPNVHLQRGATLVGYSGGKCLRGPQCAGLILGRKDLIRSVWIHSAPHHGYGRAMKVGKEEAMGMLAAVEAWVKRDHNAEWEQWMAWMNHIANRVSGIEGVATEVHETNALSNRSPGVSIRWDADKLGVTGQEVSQLLYTTEPRIALNGGYRGQRSGPETGVSVTAYMMSPGEEKIVADRLYEVLRNAPKNRKAAAQPEPPAANLSGRWDVQIEFESSRSVHTLYLQQTGERIEGTHEGDYVARELSGSINGHDVEMASFYSERHGDSLSFRFSGKVNGDVMGGALDMGEYRSAKWTGRRHSYRSA